MALLTLEQKTALLQAGITAEMAREQFRIQAKNLATGKQDQAVDMPQPSFD